MSTANKSGLETLPVELVHRIFDELDSETIIFSLRCVSKQLYSFVNTYDRYKFDFRYMSMSNMIAIARLIHPSNVISVILSDGIHKCGQIRLFLSQFRQDQFIRLRSLVLTAIRDTDLDEFQKYIMKYPLRKFTISPNTSDAIKTTEIISSIISNNGFREVELQQGVLPFIGTQWPFFGRLEDVTINYSVTWNKLHFIINHLPCLKTLTLEYVYKSSSDESTVEHTNISQPSCLNILKLNLLFGVTMADLEVFLSQLSKLTYLRIASYDNTTESLLFDGSRWEILIGKKLSLLSDFEFCFSFNAIDNTGSPTVASLIAPFQMPFWVRVKCWPVRCDRVRSRRGSRLYLYSIPFFQENFIYLENNGAVFESQSNLNNNDSMILANVHCLNVDIDDIIDNSEIPEIDVCTKYRLHNITELKLIIRRKWPSGSIERLLQTVDLSNLELLQLDFLSECQFEVRLDIEMAMLFQRAYNLRSIRINSCSFMRTQKIILNEICLKLPRHIKHLDIDIMGIIETRNILDHANHLTSIILRMYDSDSDEFTNDVPGWLTHTRRYFQSPMNRASLAVVHFWFGSNICTQSNSSMNPKRIKRTHYGYKS